MVVASTGRLALIVFLLVVGVLVMGLAYFQRVTVTGKVDCAFASWKTANYGPCSSVCHGVQYATLSVIREAMNGGKECNPLDAIRSQSCNTSVDCNQSCIPGDPSRIPWTACPICISSEIYPVQWKIIPPLQPATNGGTDCRLEDVLQTRPCEGFIPACQPNVDCVFAPYSITACNVLCGSGTQNVLQSVSVFPEGNGTPCNPAFLTLQQSCYVDCECLSFDGTFTTCNAACGLGIEARYQAGQPSTCSSIETRSCMITECENTTCSAPSVEYIQALCVLSCSGYPLPAFADGVCSTSAMMTTICAAGGAFDPCADPRDCSLSSWSSYSQCSIPLCSTARQDGGTQTAVRSIIANAVGGGVQCIDEVMLITQPCNAWASVTYEAYNTVTGTFASSVSDPQCTQSADCEYSAFYSVSTCSAPCQGTGSITYFRSVTQFPDSPFSGRQCDLSPQNLTSYSNCTNSEACKPCIWYSPDNDPGSFTFQCQYGEVGWKSEYVSLASNSNDTDCFTTGSTCTFNNTPITSEGVTYTNGKEDGVYRTLTCKAYGDVCSGFSKCPAPANLVCNGQGVPVTVGSTCTCECYEGWSGIACESFSGTQCPAGSNTQPCSGVGVCNLTNGSCTCPNGDTTNNCSAQALAWCWVYTDYVMDNCAPVSDFSWPMRKLMGAFPILDSQYGSFSIADCSSIETNGQWDPEDLDDVVLTTPAPLLSPSQTILQMCPMSGARFAAQVRSDPPATLFFKWRMHFDMSVEDRILEKVVDTTQFVHRFVPGSYPTQLESLFSQSFISNLFDVQQNTVQIETTDEPPIQYIFSLSSVTTGLSRLANMFSFLPEARSYCPTSIYFTIGVDEPPQYTGYQTLVPDFQPLPSSELTLYSITSSATSASVSVNVKPQDSCPSQNTRVQLPDGSGCLLCQGSENGLGYLYCDQSSTIAICDFAGADPSNSLYLQFGPTYSTSLSVIGGSYTGGSYT